jgi:endo-beta-N-acetylglucosaminidase D
MKKRNIFAIMALTGAFVLSTTVVAQETPTHPKYVTFGDEWVDLLDTWEPGKSFIHPDSADYSTYIDDNFFISRVKLKPRFTNVNSQANPALTADNEKKFCWWAPVGIGDKEWGPMPRYSFEADNFNMWQYLDIHGNWSNTWLRVPGAFNDAAHKNGVVTGCLMFVTWAADVSEGSGASIFGKQLTKLTTKEGGQFKYARKFVQMLKYYGIDGVGLNPEGRWSQSLSNTFQDFLIECHRLGEEELNWPFRVDWYAFVTNAGDLSSNGNQLSSNNSNWFHKSGKVVTDMFFINYGWGASQLSTSRTTAESLGRTPRDVYAGFDQQATGYGGSSSPSSTLWTALEASPLSIVIWGGHDKNELYKTSNQHGSSDLSIQNTYLKKQELLFTGGSRNAINLPPLKNGSTTTSTADLEKFHGFSKFVTAKSTLTSLPFVTRFNLGNGQWLKKDGVTTFDHKWYNIGMQDYLPTWRWWIADDAGVEPSKPIQCDLTFDDAWFGGSSLKIHGETDKSNIRLFKTKFSVTPSTEFSITYKINSGTDPKLKITLSKEGAESTFASVAVPAGGKEGEWQTRKFTMRDFGFTSPATIACIGLTVENTSSSYELLVGELSLLNPTQTFAPVTPTIVNAVPLKRIYNAVDAKVIFQSSTIKAKADGSPVYNDEVDTWYFEVYIKQANSEPRLLTTTTSWATYVASAPLSDTTDPNYQIGIRAVAPDGKTVSDFAWTNSLTSELIPVETLVIDKIIIKPDETFTIGFEDPTHANVKFEIINALTETVAYEQNNVKTITTSLPTVGCYDVKITAGEKVTMTRSLIMITPEETGSLPQINTITADKTNPAVNETVQFTYTAKKGEGLVSQALYIKDPQIFKVDTKILATTGYPYTYSLWFKPEEIAHMSKGTMLMQKINRNHSWTDNNWGEMWTVIRPAGMTVSDSYNQAAYITKSNEVSLNMGGGIAGSSYPHEDIVDDAISKGYSITPGVWTHLAITMDASKKECMYINGKKVFETTFGSKVSWSRDPKINGTNFYIGGSVQNIAGFTGWIDDVQIWSRALTESEIAESLEGYFTAPAGLEGYFTFEEINSDGSIPNNGNNTLVPTGAVVRWLADAGENAAVTEEQLTPMQDLGVPILSGGTRDVIVESVNWTLPGTTGVTPTANGADAVYGSNGTYPVTLTLKNSWGTADKTIADYIVVGTGVGINGVVPEDLSIYPNPFKESANILFASDGEYRVEIYNVSSRKIASEAYSANAGEVRTLSIDAPAGIYLVKVIKDGKCIRSFKVLKQ